MPTESNTRRPPHPGRTPAQRRALDAIGSGDFSPTMAPRVRAALLSAGLITEAGRKVIAHCALGAITVPEYEMPIPVHMQWCSAVAATDEEMAAFEAAAGRQETAGRGVADRHRDALATPGEA